MVSDADAMWLKSTDDVFERFPVRRLPACVHVEVFEHCNAGFVLLEPSVAQWEHVLAIIDERKAKAAASNGRLGGYVMPAEADRFVISFRKQLRMGLSLDVAAQTNPRAVTYAMKLTKIEPATTVVEIGAAAGREEMRKDSFIPRFFLPKFPQNCVRDQ